MPKIHKRFVEKIRKDSSNTMRKKEYTSISQSVQNLKRILEIDEKNLIAWIEPKVNMEELVFATLQHGLVPEVVPEFKGITVGGAINGAALESSSHKYGQFNDTCLEYEVMIGDGSVIWVNAQKNSDLFYGIASSYGTLGTILSAKVKLTKAYRYVKLHYHHCKLEEVFPYLAEKKADFLEAIVYDTAHAVVISGNMLEYADAPIISLAAYWAPWFYSHVQSQQKEECIMLSEYLFRHDRGAFWMGGYALSPLMSLSYLSHKLSQILGEKWDFSEKLLPKECTPRNPGLFFRSLFGWLMDSKKLYSSLHGDSEEWFEKKFAIQDFYLPYSSAAEFTKYVLKKYKIKPLWICPILSTTTPQLFSPHMRKTKELMFDIGVYGLPAQVTGPKAAKDLEALTTRLDGKKMFYCHTYFDEKEFWQLYPYTAYQELRKKYHFDNTSPFITKKVLR